MPPALAAAWVVCLLIRGADGARMSGAFRAALEDGSDAKATDFTNGTVESQGALVRESIGDVTSVGGRKWKDLPVGIQIKMPSLDSLQLGLSGEALIPSLVPPPGVVYQLKNKEKTQFLETNEYKWELDEVELGGREFEIDAKIAKLKGKWQSNSFGHKSVHVYDNTGTEIFKIRLSSNVWNPLQRRWSFRMLPPGSKDNDDALFTINKDQFGRGIPILWEKEEWRIYRGRERDNDMIYYCVGSWLGWDFKFYKSMEDYDHSARPVAKIKQKMNAGAIFDNDWLPDKFKLKVQPGEDTALLLAVSSIIDMTHDSKPDNNNHHQNW